MHEKQYIYRVHEKQSTVLGKPTTLGRHFVLKSLKNEILRKNRSYDLEFYLFNANFGVLFFNDRFLRRHVSCTYIYLSVYTVIDRRPRIVVKRYLLCETRPA